MVTHQLLPTFPTYCHHSFLLLNKIRCYRLLIHFNIDVLLKIDLMGSVKIPELLRTSDPLGLCLPRFPP